MKMGVSRRADEGNMKMNVEGDREAPGNLIPVETVTVALDF